jgi:hypothetical protein
MEYFNRMFSDSRAAALSLGLGAVVVTHVAIVTDFLPESLSDVQKKNHAYINLAAAGAILYGTRLVG